MGEGLNKVLLIGNLGQEPELRYTQGGQAVLSLSLATNERMKIRDEWQDKTEWHKIVVWAKRAEGLSKVLNKGSHIYVEGRLQTRSWEDREGNKRYTTEIVARQVLLLGKKNGGGGGDYAPPPDDSDYRGGGSGSNQDSGSGYGGGSNFDDSDLPF